MAEALSPLAAWYAAHATAWALVFCRVLGLFVFAPLLAGVLVPVQFKALLAAMMAAAVYGLMSPEDRALPPIGLMDLGMMIATEVLLGAGLGLLASLPMMAVEMAGQTIGYQLGFALASSANPDLDINLDAIGMMLFYVTLAAFLLMGGLERTVGVLLATFGDIPAGGVALGDAPLQAYVGVLTAGTDLALRIAAPVIGVVLISLLAIGFVMRTAPQFNVMSVGFAVGIILGVGAMIVALFAVDDAMRGFIADAVDAAAAWTESLGGRGGAHGG